MTYEDLLSIANELADSGVSCTVFQRGDDILVLRCDGYDYQWVNGGRYIGAARDRVPLQPVGGPLEFPASIASDGAALLEYVRTGRTLVEQAR